MKSKIARKLFGTSTLAFRFMLLISILVFIPLILQTVLHLNDLIRLKKHIFESRAESLAAAIDFDIQREKILHEPVALQSFIENIKYKNKDISRINIYGPQGEKYVVMASSDFTLIGSDAEKDDILPITTREINIIEKKMDNRSYLEVQAPLNEDNKPVASVGFYLDLLKLKEEHQATIYTYTAVIVFLFLIILLVIYLYFSRFVVKPITSLRRAMHAVAEGNLKTQASIYNLDELGEITEAFNRMTEELRNAQDKLLDMARVQASAQMAGAAAHELNQPLSAITIHGDLLLRNLPAGDPRREQVILMLDQAARMAKIIKMMSQITDYKTQPYLGDVDIIDLEKASEKKQDV